METETPAPSDPWLSQFQAEVQPLIISWFHYAVSQGARSPETVLAIVERLVNNKLDWSTTPETREACHRVLLALCHQRGGARNYAATLLTQKEMR